MIQETISRNKIKRIINKANEITSRYSKWIYPKDLQNMYKELEAIGITVGMITNRQDEKYSVSCYSWLGSCEYYYNGIEVSDSLFIMSVYTDLNFSDTKNEYTIYFS